MTSLLRRSGRRLSSVIGAAAILFVVPLALGVTYWGYSQGWFAYAFVPVVFAGVLAVVFVALLVVLPLLGQREWPR